MSTSKAERPATPPLLLSVEEVALAREPVANDSNVDDNHDDDPSPAGGAMPVLPILKDDSANDNADPPVLACDAVEDHEGPVAANDTSPALVPGVGGPGGPPDLQAEWERLVTFLKTEGSALARWLTVRRLHAIALLLKKVDPTNENRAVRLFAQHLAREINVDVATLYRWIDQAKKLADLLGEGTLDELRRTIVANDVRFLKKLPNLASRDKALSILRVYTHGRGKLAAHRALDMAIHAVMIEGLREAPAIGSVVAEDAANHDGDYRNVVLYGDALTRLRQLPRDHAHCIVTSPPFFNVRDYGVRSWFGGDPTCEHDKAITHGPYHPGQVEQTKDSRTASGNGQTATTSSCSKCGAWCGQLGLEPRVDLYIAHLVEVFRECRRVLRSDGVCWVEIDDSYSGSGRGPTGITGRGDHSKRQGYRAGWARREANMAGVTAPEMPIKNMVLVPERLVLALQADGWTVRSKVVWRKTNGLGESVTDRCSHSHSTIYQLTRSPRYFFDGLAIMEPSVENPKTKRVCRDVWSFPTGHFPGGHTATFAPQIPERCILASTSGGAGSPSACGGACAKCGAPWVRVLYSTEPIGKAPSMTKYEGSSSSGGRAAGRPALRSRKLGNATGRRAAQRTKVKFERGERFGERGSLAHDSVPAPVTLAFEPSCKCNSPDVAPCIVLDPFAGSGTVLAVAKTLGRDYLGVELNETDYRGLIDERLAEAKSEVEKRRNVAAGEVTKILRRVNADKPETPKTRRPRRRNA